MKTNYYNTCFINNQLPARVIELIQKNNPKLKFVLTDKNYYNLNDSDFVSCKFYCVNLFLYGGRTKWCVFNASNLFYIKPIVQKRKDEVMFDIMNRPNIYKNCGCYPMTKHKQIEQLYQFRVRNDA